MKIKDDRKNTNSNFLELITKIDLNINDDDIERIVSTFYNIVLLQDGRIAISFNHYLIIFSKNLYKRDLLIKSKEISNNDNCDSDIHYFTQIKNGNLLISIPDEQLIIIKIIKNKYKILGKISIINTEKVIENNNNLFISNRRNISIWKESKLNYVKEHEVNIVKTRFDLSCNFLIINNKELVILANKIIFYNYISKKIITKIGENLKDYEKNPKNMILIDEKTLLIGGPIDNYNSFILLADIIKREIIFKMKDINLFCIIKLKNGEFLCGLKGKNKKCDTLKLKLKKNELLIVDSQECHDLFVSDIVELDNDIIVTGSWDGTLKFWRKKL